MGKTLIILGNGPSLKDANFDLIKNYDTFGLNAAYRGYEKINFWPTYYGCFDFIVCNSHKKEFSKLVKKSSIKKFFFLEKKYFNENIQKKSKFQIINFKSYNANNKLSTDFINYYDAGCTGTNAVQCGIIMGYTKFILLGCDCNYKDNIEGKKVVFKDNYKYVKMDKTPSHNPNYWFDDYQREGDEFNIPNGGKSHLDYWNRMAKLIQDNKKIEIINCCMNSKITCFNKMPFEEALIRTTL